MSFRIKLETRNGDKMEFEGDEFQKEEKKYLLDNVVKPFSDLVQYLNRTDGKRIYEDSKNAPESFSDLSTIFETGDSEDDLEIPESDSLEKVISHENSVLEEIEDEAEKEKERAEKFQSETLENQMPTFSDFVPPKPKKRNFLNDVPEHVKTGIKYKHEDNIPHYKCHYECNNCGNEGNHYITPSRKFITCHNCPTDMKVVKAKDTETHEPEDRDSFGNFYNAE